MSALIRHTSTIAGFTVISRIFGFARDMMLARVLGAGLAADAYQLAFTLPNTFRRLFAEGAFSVAFVPMYSKALHGEGGEEEANRFANDVLSVFVWVLLAFSALAMVFMPAIVWVLASEYAKIPGKFDLAVFLSRVRFHCLTMEFCFSTSCRSLIVERSKCCDSRWKINTSRFHERWAVSRFRRTSCWSRQ